jgi:hypothetical protein
LAKGEPKITHEFCAPIRKKGANWENRRLNFRGPKR